MAKKKETKTEVIEKEYIIPLRRKFKHSVRYKKTPKAIKTIKEFLVRHMKVRDKDLNKIKIDGYLNEVIWQRGIKNPPAKVKVKAVKEGDIVRVGLVDFPTKLKFKKLRLEKREKAGEEVTKKKKKVAKEEEKPTEKVEEEKREKKEKAKAVAEASQKMEKATAKKSKHQAGGKTKEPKRQIRKALAK